MFCFLFFPGMKFNWLVVSTPPSQLYRLVGLSKNPIHNYQGNLILRHSEFPMEQNAFVNVDLPNVPVRDFFEKTLS